MSLAVAAFVVRVLATAGVVLGVTALVARLGPRIGGVVAGLPIVVGPGLFFLSLDETPAYVAQAAVFTLVSLSATQSFVLGFALTARRWSANIALLCAFAAWAATALALYPVVLDAGGAFALFVGAAIVTRLVIGRLGVRDFPRPRRGGLASLLLRAGLAGLLVGATTLASARLGPHLSGILLAYPVGMTVIAYTIHQREGPETLIGTLRSVSLGTISIATFGFVTAITIEAWGATAALSAALAASLAVTAGLLVASRVVGRR
ncbi:MAG: hypothetical protein MEP57_05395 [Microvirga sp.]|nr:hypothetical protein [Microvirga sp.]